MIRVSRFSTVLPLVFFNHHEASNRLLDPPVDLGVDLQFLFHDIRSVSSFGDFLIKILILDSVKHMNYQTLADEI